MTTDANTLASLMIKELGLSKEMLHQKVDALAEKMIERRLDSQRFDDLVRCALNKALNTEKDRWHGFDTLNAMAKSIVIDEMKRLITDKMVISVEGFQVPELPQ